jgi:phage regulator Rha-like protein
MAALPTLATLPESPEVTTMSSREIAELTGKEHKNILDQLGYTLAEFSANLPDSYNRPQQGFKLPKDLTITLVSGYSVPMRHRIVTRWMELEAQAKKPKYFAPTTLREANQMAPSISRPRFN